jgi:hypothetical protein
MLEFLRIQRFKTLLDASFPLSNLNLFTGLNGMGKSSVIQALLLLRQSHEVNVLSNRGLLLKGSYLNLGVGQDVLAAQAEINSIAFLLKYGSAHAQDGALLDKIRAFRSIATRQPFLSDDDMADGGDLLEVREASCAVPLSALQAAYWHDAPLVGFPTQAPWDASPLDVIVRTLGADGNLHEAAAQIMNLHSMAALSAIAPTWRTARDAAIQSGRQVWRDRDALFPALVLCGRTESQLCSWSQNATLLGQVIEDLRLLSDFTEKWRANDIAAYSHDALKAFGLQRRVSGESESCANNPKRKAERTFYLPHGEKAYFENHIKLAQGFRIHFYPNAGDQTVYVAYIGVHLS